MYNNYNYDLAIKLYCNFVLPIINITKNEHKKEYNERVENIRYIKKNCPYLMDICFDRYFELDEHSKIKKFIDNNIDTLESIFAPIHGFVDLYRYYPFNFHSVFEPIHKFVDLYRYYPFNFHSIKNYDEHVCIIERDSYGLKNITKSYFNLEHIKSFYLLQKFTKLSISNINSRIFKKMFINLYNNSNIDCNEKVESKIYD